MNILITSVGRRSYLVKYFKEAVGVNGEVHVSNSNEITPAFNYSDKSFTTPLIHDPSYIPVLKEYCIKNNINTIISLFDIDLPLLAANKKIFKEIGVKIIVSDLEIIQICNDKWKTFNFLAENGYDTPSTYITIDSAIRAINKKELCFPLIIKPRWGMGSTSIFVAEDINELHIFYKKTISEIKNSYLKFESQEDFDKSVLIQEKISGQEYGLDIINNLEGVYQNTIVKKKYAMRSGETDCAETIDFPELKNLGRSLSENLQHIANMDVDVFVNNDKIYVLELNGRFGGGYPFSHAAGINLPLAIIKWIKNEEINDLLLKESFGVIAHKEIEITRLK